MSVLYAVLLMSKQRSPGPSHGTPEVLSIVINLPRNKDRLHRFLKAYHASDFTRVPIRRLVAIDGNDVDWSEYLDNEALEQLMTMQRTGYRKAHPDLTPGAVGCYLSHLQAWRRIAESGAPYGFVFEDDAKLPRTALRTFERALLGVPSEWDIILLGYMGKGEPVTPDVKRMDGFLCLHAYAISAAAAKRLWKNMMPIRQQVDWELNVRMRDEGLDVYGLSPILVYQDWQGTDIQAPLKGTNARS